VVVICQCIKKKNRKVHKTRSGLKFIPQRRLTPQRWWPGEGGIDTWLKPDGVSSSFVSKSPAKLFGRNTISDIKLVLLREAELDAVLWAPNVI